MAHGAMCASLLLSHPSAATSATADLFQRYRLGTARPAGARMVHHPQPDAVVLSILFLFGAAVTNAWVPA
jgi:hypothetical protein